MCNVMRREEACCLAQWLLPVILVLEARAGRTPWLKQTTATLKQKKSWEGNCLGLSYTVKPQAQITDL